MSGVEVRERRPDDLDELVRILGEQQARSGYPQRWPLPFPAVEFVARPDELVAYVAERHGRLLGHVCVQRVADWHSGSPTPLAVPFWQEAHGRPVEDLAIVSALFVAEEARGSGAGALLHDSAVDWIDAAGLAACLDVVPTPGSTAVGLYERRGWRVVGDLRPEWLPADADPMLAMVRP